jgi:hypothetical protein
MSIIEFIDAAPPADKMVESPEAVTTAEPSAATSAS